MISAAPELRRCGPADIEALLPLAAAYHAFEGISQPPTVRRRTIEKLLEDPETGQVWGAFDGRRLQGYLAFTFGYSIEFGGRDAFVDELYLEKGARGRGCGRRLLEAATTSLAEAGIRALHLEVARDNERARSLYSALGFEARDRYILMSRSLG